MAAHHSCLDNTSASLDKCRFRPEDMYNDVDIDLIECYHKDSHFVLAACPGAREPCEACGELIGHTNEIIIAIDGSCRSVERWLVISY